MTPYSRPQLWILLGITALGGLGVAAGAWRRAHPDLTERIERFDADYADEAAEPSAPALGPPASPEPPRSAPPRSPAGRAPGTRPPDNGRPAKLQAAERPIDLNRASARDLERLPGIGPALAERIVAAREQAGRFASVEDLRIVPGLGRAKVTRLREFVTVSD